MESAFRFLTPPGQCGYLPDQIWRMEYEIVRELTPDEYMDRMRQGWRRFGHAVFRPRCAQCAACRSLRVVVDRFRPNRSQRRAWAANEDSVRLVIGMPSVSGAKLDLYDRYHAHQALSKGWPPHEIKDADSYVNSFVNNPFPTLEWCYFLGDKLVAVGYVDRLPGGLSAIYFFYDPYLRDRSLGTWNVLCLIRQAAQWKVPHLYLGYYVAGCQSMEYKARFVPNQILGADGQWRAFREPNPVCNP
jgi:leucyl-tRNA---protein transferase